MARIENKRRFLLAATLLTLTSTAACSTHRESAATVADSPAEVRYVAIGDSAAAGIGSRVPCRPFSACDEGTSYVGVLTRRLRASGPVMLTNMGTPGAVLSPAIESIAGRYGILLPGNFVDDELPRGARDATLVTIFGGGNDVNALMGAIRAGAGGNDVEQYVDEQVRAFAGDYERLVAGVRERAPDARIVIVNLPNFALLPYTQRYPQAQREWFRRISTGFSRAANALSGKGVAVVDLMCDARAYDLANFAGDGFHPNDHGYELMAAKLFAALESQPAAPPASCEQMSAVAGRSVE